MESAHDQAAITKLCAGFAVDCGTHPDPAGLILLAALRRVKNGDQVQVICRDENTALQRQQRFITLPESGVVSCATILAHTTLDERRDIRGSRDVIFCSAHELALDVLRSRADGVTPDDPVHKRLDFLRTLQTEHTAAEQLRRTITLLEDIDLALVEATNTSVQLQDQSEGSDGDTGSVVASTTLGRALGVFRDLAGIGCAFDLATREALEQAGIPSWPMGQPVAGSGEIIVAESAAKLWLFAARRLIEVAGQKAPVIVDSCPDDLAKVIVDQLTGTGLTVQRCSSEQMTSELLTSPTASTGVYLLDDLFEPSLDRPAVTTPGPLTILTATPIESCRLEQRRTQRLRATFSPLVGYQLVNPEDWHPMYRHLFRWLPHRLASVVASRALEARQRNHDAVRHRSRAAVRDYERQIGQLISYAGKRI